MVAREAMEGNCPSLLEVKWLPWREGGGATVPVPCRLLFRDRRTQDKHYLDTTTIVVPTVRQLSLCLVRTMVAMEAWEGNCSLVFCRYNGGHQDEE